MIFLWNFAFLTQKSRHFGLGCHQKDMDLLLFENENGKILERKKRTSSPVRNFTRKSWDAVFSMGRKFCTTFDHLNYLFQTTSVIFILNINI